jgi:excisionase family DNA binding protein
MAIRNISNDAEVASRLLTIAETAEQLHISYREIFRVIERGDLPVIRLSRRLVRIDPKDLEGYIASKREEYE